jgi:hypothetical protein
MRPAALSRTAHADALSALLLLAVGVVFITLYPFGFVRTQAVFTEQLRHAASDPFDLFLPLHAIPAILAFWLARAAFPKRKTLALAVVIALFLLATEFVQVAIRYRHARLGDVLVQWVGLGVGVWTYPLATRWLGWCSKFIRLIWMLVLICWIAGAATIVVRGQLGHNIAGWDESFPFMLGDEYQGQRPWSGVIHNAGIYAGVTAQVPIGEFEHSMVYDLTKGPECLGTIDFDLRTKNIVYSDAGLDLDAGTFAQGTRPASEISNAIQTAGGATIEINCTPALAEQTGPARILTVSKGLDVRNITAAQEGDSFVLRVRTPRSGENGSSFQSVWAGVFQADKRVNIVATTSGGRSRLWVDGKDLGEREHISKLGDWLKIRSAGKSWIAGCVLFAPLGIIALRIGRTPLSQGIVGGVSCGLPIAAALGTAQWMGLTLPIAAAVVALACLAAGMIAGWLVNLCTSRPNLPTLEAASGAE